LLEINKFSTNCIKWGKRGKTLEIESLFSSTRWEILSALANDKLSPMELAERLNTTSANISQQLRLLELGNLVKSEKTSNVDKGKPRILYSLIGDSAFLILLSKHFTGKKLLNLTAYHKFIIRSWFLENIEHHSLLLNVYSKLKDNLGYVSGIVAESNRDLTVHILTDNSKHKPFLKKSLESLKKVRVNIHDVPFNLSTVMVVLYDPSGLFYSEVIKK